MLPEQTTYEISKHRTATVLLRLQGPGGRRLQARGEGGLEKQGRGVRKTGLGGIKTGEGVETTAGEGGKNGFSASGGGLTGSGVKKTGGG